MGAITILLVEDNAGDQRLTLEALRACGSTAQLRVVQDGAEAMDYLRRQGAYADAPRPALVILDLNLPRRDGREVLAEMKTDDSLRTIPVVVLTTSRAEDDIEQCYRAGANCYITKPVDLDQFFAIIAKLHEFWLRTIELPVGEH